MGVFIGIVLIVLTMVYQNLSFDQKIDQETVMENTLDIEVASLFNNLGLLMVNEKAREPSEVSFFTKNCKENYSDILRCQRRYATERNTINDPNQTPPKEFCNAFYSYVELVKGEDERLTMSELKRLMVEVSSLKPETGMAAAIATERNFTNLLRLYTQEAKYTNYGARTLSTFTETPTILDPASGQLDRIASAQVFVDEYKEWNFKKFVQYFNVLDPDLNDEDMVNDPFDSPNSTMVTLRNDGAFLNNRVARYYYVGDGPILKEVGYKVFINKYFETIVNYRDILLKIKRLVPEVDIMLSKEFNGQSGLNDVEGKYYSVYRGYYIKYKNLLDSLGISDSFLFVSNMTEISNLIGKYNSDRSAFLAEIAGLAQGDVDTGSFRFDVVNFTTPYSNKDGLANELTDDEEREISQREMCDLSKYTRKIEY